MKRKTLLAVLLIAAVLTICLSACTSNVESIRIKNPPKTLYAIGEELDLTGGIIEVTYEDGNSRNVEMTIKSISVTGFSSEEAGEIELTVTYRKASCTFNVTIISESAELESIEIAELPDVLEYVIGSEEIDLTGGMLKLNYSDFTSVEIPMTEEDVIAEFDFSELGQAEVTLSYMGLETSFNVTVISGVVPVSISVLNPPDRLAYHTADSLELEGLVIICNYSDNSYTEISLDDENLYISYSFETTGEKEVTIEYLGFRTAFNAIVVMYFEDFALLMDEAMEIYLFGYDVLFFYYWYEILDQIDLFYASEDSDIIEEYLENYELIFVTLIVNSYSNTYSLYSEILEQPETETFLRSFSSVLFNCFNVAGYESSPEFLTDMEVVLSNYNNTDNLQKLAVIIGLVDSYTFLNELQVLYYSNFLSEEEIEVFEVMFEASLYYILYVETGYSQPSADGFIERMEVCVMLYNALPDTAAFDALFLEDYLYYSGLLEVIPKTPDEIRAVVDFFNNDLTEGNLFGLMYNDWSLSYARNAKFMTMVEELILRDDEVLNHFINNVIFDSITIMQMYDICEANCIYILNMMPEITHEFYIEIARIVGLWIDAGGVLDMKNRENPISCDRNLYTAFDADIENLFTLLYTIPEENKFIAMYLCQEFLLQLRIDHYRNVLTPMENSVSLLVFMAGMMYAAYVSIDMPNPDAIALFKTLMAQISMIYQMINQELFNSFFCGTELQYYIDIYENLS